MFDPGMIKKLQGDLQNRVEKMNEELAKQTVEGAAGGGAVRVTCTGEGDVHSVSISPEAIDPDDPEMLQDLVMAATNQAIAAARKLKEDSMSGITGGLKFPGLF